MQTVIFTGAGASVDFGYPTTTQFFEGLHSGQTQYQLLSRIVSHLETDVSDVEDVLGLLQSILDFMQTRPGGFIFSQLDRGAWSPYVDLAQFIKNRCFELYGRLPMSAQVGVAFEPILVAAGWATQSVRFFTTNYDPVTDALMDWAAEHDLPAYDGFGTTGLWRPSGYGRLTSGLDIYRLHGSMSWVAERDTIRNTRDYRPRVGGAEHVLIFPGYKGDPTRESRSVYGTAHKALIESLKSADVLLVIGFSFRDEHINRAIGEAFAENPRLRVIVATPEPPPGLDRVRQIAGRYTGRPQIQHVAATFGEADQSQNIAGHLYRAARNIARSSRGDAPRV